MLRGQLATTALELLRSPSDRTPYGAMWSVRETRRPLDFVVRQPRDSRPVVRPHGLCARSLRVSIQLRAAADHETGLDRLSCSGSVAVATLLLLLNQRERESSRSRSISRCRCSRSRSTGGPSASRHHNLFH